MEQTTIAGIAAFMNELPDGFLVAAMPPERKVLLVNDALGKMRGIREKAALADDMEDAMFPFVYGEDVARVRAERQQQSMFLERQELIYRMVRLDGSCFWVREQSHCITLQDGTQVFLFYFTDIDNMVARADQQQMMIANIPAGLIVYRKQGNNISIAAANPHMCRMVHMSDDRLKNWKLSDINGQCHPDDLPIVQRGLRDMFTQKGVSMSYRTKLSTKGTPYIWLQCRAVSQPQPDGTVLAYAVYTDITETKRTEQLVRQQEAKMLSISQSNNLVTMIRVNLSRGCIEETHGSAWEELPRETAYEQALLHRVTRVADPAFAALLEQELASKRLMEAFGQGKTEMAWEGRWQMTDGTIRWLRTTAFLYPAPDAEEIKCYIYSQDVDAQRVQEAVIERLSQMEYELIAVLTPENDELHCIRQQTSDFSLRKGNRIPYLKSLREFISICVTGELREKALHALHPQTMLRELKSKELYSCSFPLLYEGNTYLKKWDVMYLDESKTSLIVTRQDVTAVLQEQERQRDVLRMALAQAEQANHAKRNFLSHMSHEIRTPLNVILGMSALAAQSAGDPMAAADCLSKIDISAKYLLSLIDDILDMSKIESGKAVLRLERMNLEELLVAVNTVCYLQAQQKGVRYEALVLGETQAYYIADSMKLRQVLLNLLTNAVKFTEPGGQVRFTIQQIEISDDRAQLRFIISDTGIGISQSFQKVMFNPFEQAEAGRINNTYGTGLGLAICKNLLALMDGSISVDSTLGKGSTFTVQVPLGLCDAVSKKPAAAKYAGLRILVADNETAACAHTASMLHALGAEVEWAVGGKQAAATARHRLEEQTPFDVILVDWHMENPSGLDTVRQIRGIVGQDTAIAMTAYDWSGAERTARAAGVNWLLTKPLFKHSLANTLTMINSGKQQDMQKKPVGETFDFTGKRALVAEDHALNIEVARRLLTAVHMRVDVAENGKRAVEQFSSAPEGFYDVILMDVRMPVMDGLAATRAIRQLESTDGASVPIIAMSAYAFDKGVQQARDAGMDAYLTKPMEPVRLYQTIRECLSGKK